MKPEYAITISLALAWSTIALIVVSSWNAQREQINALNREIAAVRTAYAIMIQDAHNKGLGTVTITADNETNFTWGDTEEFRRLTQRVFENGGE